LPGGDPTIVIVPPIEQSRSDYGFLTPDKYIFDFVLMVAPPQALVRVGGMDAVDLGCGKLPADGLSMRRGFECSASVGVPVSASVSGGVAGWQFYGCASWDPERWGPQDWGKLVNTRNRQRLRQLR